MHLAISSYLPDHPHWLCGMRLGRHHIWRWKEDRRHYGTETGLFKGHHVGSHRSGYLYHGNRCLQGFSRNFPSPYCGQEMACCHFVVLHCYYHRNVHHHYHAAISPVQAHGLSMGPNHRGWLLLAELYNSWSDHGRLVSYYGLRPGNSS